MRSFPVVILALFTLILAPLASQGNSKAEARKHLKKGIALYEDGEYERAVIEFETSFELDGNYRTLERIARSEAALNNHDRAIAALKRFLDEGGTKVPKGKRKKVEKEIADYEEDISARAEEAKKKKQAATFLANGIKLKQRGQLKQARSKLKTAYDLYPDPVALYHLGFTESRLGLNSEAIATLKRCLDEGYKTLAASKRKEARREIDRLQKIVAGAAQREQGLRHFKDGKGFYNRKQYERAAISFDKAHAALGDPKYLFYIGRTAVKLGENEKAHRSYSAFLKKSGNKADAAKRGEAQREIKRLEPLLARQKTADTAREHFRQGIEHYDAGRYDAAIKSLDKAYRLEPTYKTLYNLGQAQAEAKKYSKALASYRKYLNDGGDNVPDKRQKEVKKQIDWLQVVENNEETEAESKKHFKKGLKLKKEKKYSAAIIELEKAYELKPNYKIIYAIAVTADQMDDHDQAIENYRRYLEEGGKKIETMRRVEVKTKVEELEKRKREALSTAAAASHYKRGKALKKAGKHEEALEELAEAYRLSGNYKVQRDIGATEVFLGRSNKAINAYRKFLKEGGDRIPKKTRVAIQKKIEKLTQDNVAAEQRTRATRHHDKGLALLAKKKYSAALYEFQKSWDFDPNYEVLYSVAQCHEKLDHVEKAIKAYEGYLNKGGGKIPRARRSEVKKEISRLYGVLEGN